MVTRSNSANFWKLPLSKSIRRRLASIDESRIRSPSQKMALAKKLLAHSHDSVNGVYVPLSSHVYLPAKLTENFADLPQAITADLGTPLCFFGNPLLLPEGYDEPDFDIARSLKPVQRATNAGFLVVTAEHDCQRREQLEEIVGSTAPSLEFKKVDADLREYKEYCGYCAVLSGNKSVHFHFLFDTRHLAKAPFDIGYEERIASWPEQSAIMHNAHRQYWDRTVELMDMHLRPPLAPDLACRNYTQFKRISWGRRELAEHSELLDLPAGTVVSQLVLMENIRPGRSPKGSGSFLVPSDFSPRLYAHRSLSPVNSAGPEIAEHGGAMLQELSGLCQLEWGTEFPKPVSMDKINGEWIIKFRNHSGDQTPSTVARGNFVTLLLCGSNAPSGELRLPGSLTAQELGDHLARRFGLMPPVVTAATCVAHEPSPTPFQRLKSASGMSLMRAYEVRAKSSFPIFSTRPVADMRALYRDKLAAECAAVRVFGTDTIILSAEGIGKTYALFGIMAEEALDTAMSYHDRIKRFFCFACKSLEQATAKAAEYATEHRRAVVIESFWRHYSAACQTVGKTPIERHEFDEDTSLIHVLDVIKLSPAECLR